MIRFLVGDAERRVEVSSDGATIDGQAYALEVAPVGAATYALRRGASVETFHCVREGDAVHLFWRGRAYRFEVLREGRRGAHRHGGGGLEAPMPGKVTAVKARAGQAVAKGEEILVVEAMKMENAIRAPKAGRVKVVHAQVGEMVAPGEVLAEIE
ncbi:MAG TPA: biotin/lipoyl-containing protein [Vicinamibacteria bacterium]|nr:biotin/lipoyl-containing protein [Vicinamibacteria bacterium]